MTCVNNAALQHPRWTDLTDNTVFTTFLALDVSYGMLFPLVLQPPHAAGQFTYVNTILSCCSIRTWLSGFSLLSLHLKSCTPMTKIIQYSINSFATCRWHSVNLLVDLGAQEDLYPPAETQSRHSNVCQLWVRQWETRQCSPSLLSYIYIQFYLQLILCKVIR